MSRILVPLYLLALTISPFSQIATQKVSEQPKSFIYDSTQNFLGENSLNYKGATLYLLGKSPKLQGFGYDNFKTKKESESFDNVYKCCAVSSKFNTKYEAIAGKSFLVVNIEKIKTKTKLGTYMDMGYFQMQLQNLDDNSMAYFTFNEKYEHSFPFIDMRYFEKTKTLTIGNEYIVKKNSYPGDSILDVNGNKVEQFWVKKWKCVDVIVEEKHYTLSLLLESQDSIKITFNTDRFGDNRFIMSVEVAENYRKQFGEYFDAILQNKVAIGMSKEMVELSWGKPKDVNKTIVSNVVKEQWVFYSGNYVYFENGIVDAIQ